MKRSSRPRGGRCVCAKSFQSCRTLCDPMDRSLPGSSVHGILQARILEWAACPSPGDLSDLGLEPMSPPAPALQADSLLLSHMVPFPFAYLHTIVHFQTKKSVLVEYY